MRRELAKLEDERSKVGAENDKLTAHADRFCREKMAQQQENEKALKEKDNAEEVHR